MTDSAKVKVNYARTTAMATTDRSAQSARRFRPRLWPTLAAALLVLLFISAGQWQWNKATSKASLQMQLDARATQPATRIPTTLLDAQSLRYRKIVAHGHYEAQYQILIDNRMHREQAGYHVITPLRLEGSELRVLINRGWIPALADHRQVPQITTPSETVDVSGTAVVPAARFFTLGADNVGPEWQNVWQNLDLDRYVKAVDFPIQPIVIELGSESTAGGFVREWRRPDERLQTNLGYALQWWSFAATTFVLWLVVNYRKQS